jgi:HEAT repeat protein
MAAVSPPVYWELAADALAPGDDAVRLEAAAALEQMAPPQAVKALEKALGKEKKPEVIKDLVRALAACGAADPKVRAEIVKRARTEKNDLVRLNTIVALGLVDRDDDVQAVLKEILAGKDDAQRTAAVCAAGLSRDESWISVLEPLTKDGNAAVADASKRALEVLRGGPMQRLQMPVWTICKDTVTRERTFGRTGS